MQCLLIVIAKERLLFIKQRVGLEGGEDIECELVIQVMKLSVLRHNRGLVAGAVERKRIISAFRHKADRVRRFHLIDRLQPDLVIRVLFVPCVDHRVDRVGGAERAELQAGLRERLKIHDICVLLPHDQSLGTSALIHVCEQILLLALRRLEGVRRAELVFPGLDAHPGVLGVCRHQLELVLREQLVDFLDHLHVVSVRFALLIDVGDRLCRVGEGVLNLPHLSRSALRRTFRLFGGAGLRGFRRSSRRGRAPGGAASAPVHGSGQYHKRCRRE